MRIHVIRHGKAERHTTDDAARDLLDLGRQQAHILGRHFVRLGIVPDAVFTSPFVRARETARHTLEAMGLSANLIRVSALLQPGSEPVDAAELLMQVEGREVFCFTHAPLCDRLVAILAGTETLFTSMKTAAAACLTSDPDGAPATLAWLVHPALLDSGEA